MPIRFYNVKVLCQQKAGKFHVHIYIVGKSKIRIFGNDSNKSELRPGRKGERMISGRFCCRKVRHIVSFRFT
jgi:hypothetical protein